MCYLLRVNSDEPTSEIYRIYTELTERRNESIQVSYSFIVNNIVIAPCGHIKICHKLILSLITDSFLETENDNVNTAPEDVRLLFADVDSSATLCF